MNARGLLAVALLVAEVAVGTTSAHPQASCAPVWRPAPRPPLGDGVEAQDVRVFDRNDVWVLVPRWTSDDAPAVWRWDGTSWQELALPALEGEAFALDGSGPDDVWVVGRLKDASGVRVAVHWEGTSWSLTPLATSPAGYGFDVFDVSASSSGDAWVVGRTYGGGMTQHWDGASWSWVKPYPLPKPYESLQWVSARARDDAWAAGYLDYGIPIVQHWDGSEWSPRELPPFGTDRVSVNGVLAVAADDAWLAVSGPLWSDPLPDPFARWDGVEWRRPATPLSNAFGISGSRSDIWATVPGGLGHWDGESWSYVEPHGEDVELLKVGAASGGDAWAAGRIPNVYGPIQLYRVCPTRVGASGFDVGRVVVRQGETVAWRVVDGTHSVADASGAGLFGSGPMEAGRSFTSRLDAAGTYPVVDATSGDQQLLTVGVEVAPRRGTPTVPFTITWSSRPPPVGAVFDVQLRRPTSDSFRPWKISQLARGTSWISDAGAGTYAVRARVRRLATGAATGWSPPRTFIVT